MASRKRKALTLQDKKRILEEVDKNGTLSQVKLANKLNLPASTLRTIIYKRNEIEENYFASGPTSSKKMRIQTGKFAHVEEIVLNFFNHCRSSNVPVNGPMLIQKAKEVAGFMNIYAEFSNGWLHRFKVRHGITGKVMNGELSNFDTKSKDVVTTDNVKETLKLVSVKEEPTDFDKEIEDNYSKISIPSFDEVQKALKTLQCYFMSHKGYELHVVQLNKMRNDLLELSKKESHQS